MNINNVDFGRLWAASGTLGVFGEAYPFHHLYRLAVPGFETEKMTFVAKTVTTLANVGNMPLRKDWQPSEWFPKCIWWSWRHGVALNAVGLSNFGFKAALSEGLWQKRTAPFMLSWMPLGNDHENNARTLVSILKPRLMEFTAPVALQVNLSCPNTGENLAELTKGAVAVLKILEELGIPLVPKFNVLTTPEMVADIASKASVDGIVISNTIPFGTRGFGIKWRRVTGMPSPLTGRGIEQPGGLSGTILFPIVRQWVLNAHKPLSGLPVNFCGGVDSPARVHEALSLPNVQSVSVGTAVMLRPWRMRAMAKAALG